MVRPSSAELAELSVKERQELWDAHRQRPFQVATGLITSIAVLLSLGFTGFGLVYTARALRSTQEGQLTDRYTKAVEQLASPAVDVRLGAIFALQRLASDSPRDRGTIRNLLAAFVRNRDFCPAVGALTQCTSPLADLILVRTIKPLPIDVAAALTTALRLTRDGDQPADISETRFPRVQFPIGSQLTGIDLSRSDLTWAGFSGANLTSVNLRAACLTRANLTDANLSNATLYQADLYRAQLGQTNLSGADLRGADLRGVFGQTPEQIRRVARTDADTLFGTAAGPAQSCGPTRLVGTQIHPR